MDTTTLNTNRLKECREKLGITKQEAARRMAMSQPAYLRYELGQRIPSIHVIYVMADVLNTSAEYLLGQTDNPNRNRYVINEQNDNELFNIIELYKNADNDTKSRLLTYMKEINK